MTIRAKNGWLEGQAFIPDMPDDQLEWLVAQAPHLAFQAAMPEWGGEDGRNWAAWGAAQELNRRRARA